MELCFSNLLIKLYFRFPFNWHTFQNQPCVSRKSKIRKWKKIKRFGTYLINYNLIHNNKFKMNKGNNYTYTNISHVNPVIQLVGLNQILVCLFFHIFVSNAFILVMHSLKRRCFDPTSIKHSLKKK